MSNDQRRQLVWRAFGAALFAAPLIFVAAASAAAKGNTFTVNLPAHGAGTVFSFTVSWPVKPVTLPHFTVGTLSGAAAPSWGLRGVVVTAAPVRKGTQQVESVFVAISNLASAAKQHLTGQPADKIELIFEGINGGAVVSQQGFDHTGCAQLKAALKRNTTGAQPLPGIVIGTDSRLKTVQKTLDHDSAC